MDEPERAHFKISLTPNGGPGSCVELNGQDITKYLKALTVDASAGKSTTVTLSFLACAVEIDAEAVMKIDGLLLGGLGT